MKKLIFNFLALTILSSASILGNDEELIMGYTFINGKEYSTSLKISDLHKNDNDKGLDFPLTIEQARVLCDKQIKDTTPHFKEYVCSAGTVLRYTNGKIIQLLYNKNISALGKQQTNDPALYFYVTGDGRVISPEAKN